MRMHDIDRYRYQFIIDIMIKNHDQNSIAIARKCSIDIEIESILINYNQADGSVVYVHREIILRLQQSLAIDGINYCTIAVGTNKKCRKRACIERQESKSENLSTGCQLFFVQLNAMDSNVLLLLLLKCKH